MNASLKARLHRHGDLTASSLRLEKANISVEGREDAAWSLYSRLGRSIDAVGTQRTRHSRLDRLKVLNLFKTDAVRSTRLLVAQRTLKRRRDIAVVAERKQRGRRTIADQTGLFFKVALIIRCRTVNAERTQKKRSVNVEESLRGRHGIL